jgi:hypothetical protein
MSATSKQFYMEKKRNLWVTPTDKPSRLFIAENDIEMFILSDKCELGNKLCKNQNINITNSEEIKEGDWFIEEGCELPIKAGYNKGLSENCKKIILTTDEQLIKDGVQAIDDEFLEWFVKNPSCEEVEVIYEPKNFLDTKQGWEYEIIIPKEEPKQENDYTALLKPVGTKQETLEEGKLNEKEFYVYMAKQDSWKSVGLIIQEFIQLKLKEQDKKLYSEEEVIQLLIKFNQEIQEVEDVRGWFEQFKNK